MIRQLIARNELTQMLRDRRFVTAGGVVLLLLVVATWTRYEYTRYYPTHPGNLPTPFRRTWVAATMGGSVRLSTLFDTHPFHRHLLRWTIPAI